MNDYQRIAKAVDFLSQHVEQQPTLADVAAQVHLSAFHFQRLFCQWAGVSPKRFLQILTTEKAKTLLSRQTSLMQTAEQLGLSSTSRLYDHFVTLEAVTPGEYKSGGQQLHIEYGIHPSLFGDLLIAQTPRGICNVAFIEGDEADLEIRDLHNRWPHAVITENPASTATVASMMAGLSRGQAPEHSIPLHVSGTNFQVAVWRALLNTGAGDTVSYSDIAGQINKPASVRAVANAIAANPVALLIPCHRVIRKSGALGGYRWGEPRKQVIRVYEHIAQHTETA
ncbi:methylated-DNA--[protein]-cysteine S-methyltransferase [Gammaproteobacteria bacterium LSUCC0112]|nr:methylated-DNA--[protein]-cysteine S-methyltransferase [Gammaproteobacteria bacterium LSUCC0112]